MDLYQSSKKFEKIKVAKRIVDYIHKQSPRGRFIKRDKTGVWAELDAKQAVRKTSQTFRDVIGEQKSRSSKNDQASDGSHASATDSMISELYAQAEATTNGSTLMKPGRSRRDNYCTSSNQGSASTKGYFFCF